MQPAIQTAASNPNYEAKPHIDTPQRLIVSPQAGGQTEFLSCPPWIFECLFGGHAGPGKSWALVIDALGFQFEHTALGMPAYKHPEYRAYLFRRTTTRIGELIDLAKKYYHYLGARFVYGRRGDPGPSFVFPYYLPDGSVDRRREGARVFFCHMEHEKDKDNYHGKTIHFAGFDELGEFLLSQYLYIFTRTRSTVPGLTPRVRATSNPIGIGLKWVRKRFIVNCKPKYVYYYIADGAPELNPQGVRVKKGGVDAYGYEALPRVFIPGFLEENKILMEEDPQYPARIAQLGEKYVEALLKGNWDIFEGQAFDMLSRDIHQIKPFDVPSDWPAICGVDYGNVTCAHIIRFRPGDWAAFVEYEWTEIKKTKDDKAESFANWLQKIGHENIRVIGDTNMFAVRHEVPDEKTPATAFKEAAKTRGFELDLSPVVKSSPDHRKFRVFCVQEVKTLLNWKKDPDGFWIREAKLFFMEGRCPRLFESLFDLQIDEDNPEDINSDNDDDHWFDDMKYALISAKKPISKQDLERLDQEYNKNFEESAL